MCDFPLPCRPQINAENGTFVLRKSLGSVFAVTSDSFVGQMLLNIAHRDQAVEAEVAEGKAECHSRNGMPPGWRGGGG